VISIFHNFDIPVFLVFLFLTLENIECLKSSFSVA